MRWFRLKNRFAEPLFNGYRDALYSVRVSSGDISHMSVNCNCTSRPSSRTKKRRTTTRHRRRAEPNLPIAAMA